LLLVQETETVLGWTCATGWTLTCAGAVLWNTELLKTYCKL